MTAVRDADHDVGYVVRKGPAAQVGDARDFCAALDEAAGRAAGAAVRDCEHWMTRERRALESAGVLQPD